MFIKLWQTIRLVCYTALALACVGLAALLLPYFLGYCTDGGAGQLVCTPGALQTVRETGFALVMFGAYTFVPALLALFGFFILLRDIFSGARNDDAEAPSAPPSPHGV